MVRFVQTLLATAVAAGTLAYAQAIKPECGPGLGKCPSHKPCCSQYGVCGVGAYCLGGCDPLFSTERESCVANPVCKSKRSTFENLDKVVLNTKYLGDASKYDWVVDGRPVIWENNLLLTMAKDTVGTVLSSTTYMLYGKATATLKTSRGAGVVSSFILFSGVRDEIDYEWVGVDLNTAQTNYYFQGIPDYNNGRNSSIPSDSHENFHKYEIEWTPEKVTWSIDGKVGRVLERKDTLNETTGIYHYPQTPARVQFSLWPGGLPTNAEGTINWAGGVISWDHPDVKKSGYYYVTIKEITMECYDPPADIKKKGSKAYIYEDDSGLEKSVAIVDKDYILSSFLATGTDMDKKPEDVKDDDNKGDKGDKGGNTSNNGTTTDEDVETIPGLSGGGTSVNDYIGKNNDNDPVTPADPNDNGLSQTGGNTEFDQGLEGGPGQSTGGAAEGKPVGGSIFAVAVVIAIASLVL